MFHMHIDFFSSSLFSVMSSKIATEPIISPFVSVRGADVEETIILEPSSLSIIASSLTIFSHFKARFAGSFSVG
jgi:hypothetical protein